MSRSRKKRGDLAASLSPIRVGLLGLGVVGTGVAEILTRHRRRIAEQVGVELCISRALVRRRRKTRVAAAQQVPLTTQSDEVVRAEDVDIVVEVLGGIDPARALIKRALVAGKPVVTANKAVLAAHGSEILAAAARARTDIFFEAAVAGGIPIIRTLREGIVSDRIMALCGILNGTTNYILERMTAGESYADALAQAQRLGYAEANPELDVSGRDAADKLAILVRLAFGTRIQPQRIPSEGIAELTPDILADAESLGFRTKLLAIARRAPGPHRRPALDLRVHPALVPMGHVLSTVPGVQNAIAIESEALGTTLYQGPGAGGLPTGSAVVSDLIEAARTLRAGISGRVASPVGSGALQPLPAGMAVSRYYARLLVAERPGVLASIAHVFAKQEISLATVWQRQRASRQAVPIVLTTHPAPYGSVRAALKGLRRLAAVRGAARVVRIEDR